MSDEALCRYGARLDHDTDTLCAVDPMIELLEQRLLRRTPPEIGLPAKHQAALAVILAPNCANGLDLLLIQRAERAGDPWSGHMALPGGRREPSDPDLDATAVRETREETGIDLTRARRFGALDDVQPIRQSERVLVVRPFVFLTSARPALELSSEVANALWVPLGALVGAAAEVDVDHRGGRLRVPAYLIGDRVVWGMTQRVLAGLIGYGVT